MFDFRGVAADPIFRQLHIIWLPHAHTHIYHPLYPIESHWIIAMKNPYSWWLIHITTCYIHAYIHTYTHAYIHAYIHTYRHTYINIYISIIFRLPYYASFFTRLNQMNPPLKGQFFHHFPGPEAGGPLRTQGAAPGCRTQRRQSGPRAIDRIPWP